MCNLDKIFFDPNSQPPYCKIQFYFPLFELRIEKIIDKINIELSLWEKNLPQNVCIF